jgi:hypothetical protein
MTSSQSFVELCSVASWIKYSDDEQTEVERLLHAVQRIRRNTQPGYVSLFLIQLSSKRQLRNQFCACVQQYRHTEGLSSAVACLHSKFLCSTDFQYLKSVRHKLKVSFHCNVEMFRNIYKINKYVYPCPQYAISYNYLYRLIHYRHTSEVMVLCRISPNVTL